MISVGNIVGLIEGAEVGTIVCDFGYFVGPSLINGGRISKVGIKASADCANS